MGGTNHESPQSDKDYFALFLSTFPEYTERIQLKFRQLREKDFGLLDNEQCTYLDYTGSMLSPDSLIDEHQKLLKNTILGNPHSVNNPSMTSSDYDHRAREAVLKFANANPDEYTVIWTHNATGALKTLGEAYPFSSDGAFLYAPDCHNSVVGISEFASSKGARVSTFKFDGKSWCWDEKSFVEKLDSLSKKNGKYKTLRRKKSIAEKLDSLSKKNGKYKTLRLKQKVKSTNRLLGIPAQSNVSGLQNQYKKYIQFAQKCGWDVVLDAAALAPSGALDLTDVKPEYVCLSFYKIFGYPTGIGALIAKKNALPKLSRPWFGGGTVRAVGVLNEIVTKAMVDKTMPGHFEDGTINFQQTSAVELGLKYFSNKVGAKDYETHIFSLMSWLKTELSALYWDDEKRFPLIYFPEIVQKEVKQGSSVSFRILSSSGEYVPMRLIEEMANNKNISIRTGCFCNPGSSMHQLIPEDEIEKFVNGIKTDPDALIHEYRDVAMARVSIGIPTTFEDCYRFICFLKEEILCQQSEFEFEVEKFLLISREQSRYAIC